MKSAMVSRQGSTSRLQGPRIMDSQEPGSTRRKRVTKSVTFDKTDEVIQYVAATPEISEDNWDGVSLESCDSDKDNRPLPSPPPAPEPPTTADPRAQTLLHLPRYKAKLSAPLGTSEEDFDFGTPQHTDLTDDYHTPPPSDEPGKPQESQDPATLLPSPLLGDVSPIIDRPPMELRMDAIMASESSGLSPSLRGTGSWQQRHHRTGSQMSDFSDGGSESYLPVRRVPLHTAKEEEEEEPAQWRDTRDQQLARQDSLQEDQRHPPTQRLSSHGLPLPVQVDRTHSKRKKQLQQLLDPHGAGTTQTVGFNAIPEEVEEEEEEEKEEEEEDWFAGTTAANTEEIEQPTEEHLRHTGDTSVSHANLVAPTAVGDDSRMTIADQSIGISKEPAAMYAAGMTPDLADSDFSREEQPSLEQLPEIEHFEGPSLARIPEMGDDDDSYHNHNNVLDESTFLHSSPKSSPQLAARSSSSPISSPIASPIAIREPETGHEASEASAYSHQDSVFDHDLHPETSSDSDVDENDDLVLQPDSTVGRIAMINESYEFNRTLGNAEERREEIVLKSRSTDDRNFTGNATTTFQSLIEADEEEDDDDSNNSSMDNSIQDSIQGSDREQESVHNVLDNEGVEKEAISTSDPKPIHNAYPGVLPWDPSMDTTSDNIAAMATPEIPPRSPERYRRSLRLDLPLQAYGTPKNKAEQVEPTHPASDSFVAAAGWEPENEDDEMWVSDSEDDEASQSEDGDNAPSVRSIKTNGSQMETPLLPQHHHLPANEEEHAVKSPEEAAAKTTAEAPAAPRDNTNIDSAASGEEVEFEREGFDPGVLLYIASNEDLVETQEQNAHHHQTHEQKPLPQLPKIQTGVQVEDSAEAPTKEQLPQSPQEQPVFLKNRQASTASLRNKHSFVPSTVPTLSPISVSGSPLIAFDKDLSGVASPPAIDEVVTSKPQHPVAAAALTGPNPGYRANGVNSHSVTPSVATDGGDNSILRDMCFDDEELARLQQKTVAQEDEHDSPRNQHEVRPELDSDLSDVDNNPSPTTGVSAPSPPAEQIEIKTAAVSEVPRSTTTGDKTLQELQQQLKDLRQPRSQQDQQQQQQQQPQQQPENNINEKLHDYKFEEGDISIQEPSFGENMASTMMSLFSDNFPSNSASAGLQQQQDLERSSSRQSYVIRESSSYVIATSPQKRKQRSTQAYEVISGDSSEAAVVHPPQPNIQRNRNLPSAPSTGAFSFAPSDITQAGSSSYSLSSHAASQTESHTGSYSGGGAGAGAGGMSKQSSERRPLAAIQEPEEDALFHNKEPSTSPIRLPRMQSGDLRPSPAKKGSSNVEIISDDDSRTPSPQRAAAHSVITPSASATAMATAPRALRPVVTAIPEPEERVQEPPTTAKAAAVSATPDVVPQQAVTDVASPYLNSLQPSNSLTGSMSESDKTLVGLLYFTINGITMKGVPETMLATLQIDNGVHCIASKTMPVSEWSAFTKEYRVGFQEGESAYTILKLSNPTGKLDPASLPFKTGSDGSFAKFDLSGLRKSAFGQRRPRVELSGVNVWEGQNAPVVATAMCDVLYVPYVSRRDKLPKTLKEAESLIAQAQSENQGPPRAHGFLRQYGGDVKSTNGKERYVVLDPVAPLLVAHSVRSRRPRSLINIAKATSVRSVGGRLLEIRFKNRESLAFHAHNSTEFARWYDRLNAVVGTSDGSRPKWLDAILYETQ